MEAIQQDMLHCKICLRVLYEPFMNPCGHTFCYSCLNSTFEHNTLRGRVNCPECRAPIRNAPAPNYLVRQLVDQLITKPSFMVDDETPELHKTLQSEEAQLVERDRLSPEGLFKGRFKPRPTRYLPRRIHDTEDGVDRCPECQWEVSGDADICDHCGFDLADDDSDEYDDNDTMLEAMDYYDGTESQYELDAELARDMGLEEDEDDGEDDDGHRHHHIIHSMAHFEGLRSVLPGRPIQIRSGTAGDSDTEGTHRQYSDDAMDFESEDGSDDDEEEEDDEDTSMDGFIDNDDEEGDNASNPLSISSSPAPDSDSEGDSASEESGESSLSEGESEMTQPRQHVPAATEATADKRRRRNRPIVIESSDDESSDDDEDDVVRPRRRLRAG